MRRAGAGRRGALVRSGRLADGTGRLGHVLAGMLLLGCVRAPGTAATTTAAGAGPTAATRDGGAARAACEAQAIEVEDALERLADRYLWEEIERLVAAYTAARRAGEAASCGQATEAALLVAARRWAEAGARSGGSQSFDLACLRTTLAGSARLDASAWCHINVLPATLQGAVGDQVLELLARRIAPSRLCLEIDAREMVGDPVVLRPHRASLAAAGVRLALENAAFDAATLEALIILKPDIVKVAPAMIERATRESGRARELRRLVHAAQGVGAEVVAAGVQVHESVELLTAMGITLGQGYLWNRPTELPENDRP